MLKAEKRNYAKIFTLELYACEFCELCVQVCPTDAIIMMKSFDMATADRREMLLDKDRLHAIGLQHEPSWATGNRLRDMQAPPKKRRRAEKPASRQGSRMTLEIAAFWVLRRRPRRRGTRRRPQQEPVSLGAVAGAGARRDGRHLPDARRRVPRRRADPALRRRRRHRRRLRDRRHRAAGRRAPVADEPARRRRRRRRRPRCSRCSCARSSRAPIDLPRPPLDRRPDAADRRCRC